MMKQGSVLQLRRRELLPSMGYIVIGMCFYPRGVSKEWRHEYRADLAPDRELFREWKNFEKTSGHDAAFRLTNYETRFTLKSEALVHLDCLCEREEDVYLICQCQVGERCHREMLMLL